MHRLFVLKSIPVEKVIGVFLAMMKLDCPENLGSSSLSVARLGSELNPHAVLLNPHTRYAKFLVVLKPGEEVQLRRVSLQAARVSDLVQHTPF